MRPVDDRIKRRREKRIRALSEEHVSWPTVTRGVANHPPFQYEQKRHSRLALQTLIALLLFALTYISFQTDTPASSRAQGLITEVMERDFNFQGVADWYEAHVGGMPAIIPTFSKNNTSTKKENNKPQVFLPPIKGVVTLGYSENHPYLTFSASATEEIKAGAEGLVSFIGVKEGFGNTVIVTHAGGMESWYGPIEGIKVAQSDWIEPGEVLGGIAGSDGTVTFGVTQDGHFIDPTLVMEGD